MTRFHDKAEGRTKQIIGQMIGDDKLVVEGQEEERRADDTGKKEPRGRPAGTGERK